VFFFSSFSQMASRAPEDSTGILLNAAIAWELS